MLAFIVSGRKLHVSIPVDEFECRSCGSQPDLFSIATGRQAIVCWECGEGSWHRQMTPANIRSIPCPRCAQDPGFPHDGSCQQTKCDQWKRSPKHAPAEWACACCGSSSVILKGDQQKSNQFNCVWCQKSIDPSKQVSECGAHVGPVAGGKFLCCQSDVAEHECKNTRPHSRYG
jgi:hypothetical protein